MALSNFGPVACPKGHGNIGIKVSESVPNAYELRCKQCGAFAPSNRQPIKWQQRQTGGRKVEQPTTPQVRN